MFLRFAGKMTLTATVLAVLSCGLLQHFYPTMPLRRELFLSAIWGLFLFLTLATALAQLANLLKGRVKLVTVTFSQVVDVTRTYIFRQGDFTRFGFTSAGREVKRAQLKGKPNPVDGATFSMVLGEDENWTKVYGWLDHETGEMYVDAWYGSLFLAWVVFLAVLMMGVEAMQAWAFVLPVVAFLCISVRYSLPVYSLYCAQRLLVWRKQ